MEIKQVCELCYKKSAKFLIYIRGNSWKFCCESCEDDNEFYWIDFRRIKNEDWLSHLSEKNWFNDTKEEFLKRYLYVKKQ